MKRWWMAAGIAVMCLPMAFVIWLMLSAYWPKMDAVTLKLPMGLRSLVAEVVVKNDVSRAKRLDADVQMPQTRRYGGNAAPNSFVAHVNSPEARELDRQGKLREDAGDECGAVSLYTEADGNEDRTDAVYRFAEHKGRAALLCGKHLAAAQVGLEDAITKEKRLLQFSVGDESDTQAAMLKDREWLMVVYNRVGEADMAKDLCKVAHPDWKSCECSLVGKDVRCVAGQ
jgi:hypothetical protein